jgi:adenosylhomocysteine nucleosidase
MKILLTFAVKAEFSPWSSRHPFVPYEFENWERRREFDLFKANFGPHELTVLLTGMGRESTVEAMGTIPVELHDVCISSGLAGALDPGLKPGDVVAARTAETLDKALSMDCDHALANLAASCGGRVVDSLLTSDRIIATADAKQELSLRASAVDMETAYVLAAAAQVHVPAMAIRAISDAADEDLPVDFSRLLGSHGNLKFGGLFTEVGLHPYRIAPLIKFARQSRAASVKLADFLDRYISELSQHWSQLRSHSFEEVSAT